MKIKLTVLALALPMIVAACGSDTSDRIAGGGAVGAGTGAAVGALAGGVGAIPGALFGGLAGAGTGALTDDDTVDLGEPVWK